MSKNAVSKAINIIMVASLLIAIVAQALYPTQIAALTSPGNILYDPFDDDTTLGKITGTVSFLPSDDNGQGFDMGQSLCFDGGGTWGGYILYGVEGQPSPFVTNPGTLELWVRKESWVLPEGSREDILSTNTGNTLGIHLYLLGPVKNVLNSKSTLQLLSKSTSTSAVVYKISSEEDLSSGWHHFAIAWDDDETVLYIDGVYIGEGGGNTSEHNTLGLSAGEELDGCIDEFASYDSMKSDLQIRQDFEAQSSPHKIPEPPIADANGPYMGAEGSPITFYGSSPSDPYGTIFAYDWDLDGDGLFDDETGATTSYTWGDDYAGDVGLKVTDNDGLSDTDNTTTVNVSNVAPTVVAGANQTVNQGDMVSLSGNFTDPGWLDTHTIHWDFGDTDTADGDLEVDHLYADLGTFTVTLTVTDDDGGAGSDTLQVTVVDINYDAPTSDANGPYSGYEGSPITFAGGSSSDPDGTIDAYDWDLNDDSLFDDATGEIASYTWDDDNALINISLKVTDNDGLSDTDTTTVTVSNVAPTVVAGDNQTVNQGDTVSFNGSFTDPGLDDTHTILWDFGDGGFASGNLTVDHLYADSGTYTANLTVTDDDGGAGSDTLQVTVIGIIHGARAMLEFQIEKAKIEVSKGKVSVKGTLELDPSGDGVDISEEVVVIMGPLSETIPGGTMVVDKKGKWEYKQPKGDEGIIKNMKIDWKKGEFEFSMDKAYLSKLTDPDNVTISIQIGDDFGQNTITMVITYEYVMPR